jgi:hypothetical protein
MPGHDLRPPPELQPRQSDITTQTIVFQSTLASSAGWIKFVQFEPSGRIVEYTATVTSALVLRDAPDDGCEQEERRRIASRSYEQCERDRGRIAALSYRRRAGAQAFAERMLHSEPY